MTQLYSHCMYHKHKNKLNVVLKSKWAKLSSDRIDEMFPAFKASLVPRLAVKNEIY